MLTFKITIEETDHGWESTVDCSDGERQGPMSLLHAEPTLPDALRVVVDSVDSMTGRVYGINPQHRR